MPPGGAPSIDSNDQPLSSMPPIIETYPAGACPASADAPAPAGRSLAPSCGADLPVGRLQGSPTPCGGGASANRQARDLPHDAQVGTDAPTNTTFPNVSEILSVFARPGRECGPICDEIRSACLRYALYRELPQDPGLLFLISSWLQWFETSVARVDSVVSVHRHHEFGYVSQVDLVAELNGIGWAVINFETQEVQRAGDGAPAPLFAPTWPLRLCAAQQAILSNSARNVTALVSVVIDRARPGPIHMRLWNCGLPREHDYFRTFLAAFAVWKYLNLSDPPR